MNHNKTIVFDSLVHDYLCCQFHFVREFEMSALKWHCYAM